jgi:hypothetical protein
LRNSFPSLFGDKFYLYKGLFGLDEKKEGGKPSTENEEYFHLKPI